MKVLMTMCMMTLWVSLLIGQTVADFEGFQIEKDTFLNGSDGSGGFASGNIFLPNDYNTEFSFWSGWSISSATDNTTPGFTNQYSAISGAGFNSDTYATTFVSGESIIILENDATGGVVEGLYINNGTYPYLSMQDGDSFAKRFGGIDGTDPDFFLLTIKSYTNGVLSQDSVDFYLADFRFDNSSDDYILDEWTFVSLETLGNIDSLSFTLSSSDNGTFGMNTPAYFCIDDLTTRDMPTSIDDQLEVTRITVFPNPTTDYINVITNDAAGLINITDVIGNLIYTEKISLNQNVIDVSRYKAGLYNLSVQTKGGITTQTFVKK